MSGKFGPLKMSAPSGAENREHREDRVHLMKSEQQKHVSIVN